MITKTDILLDFAKEYGHSLDDTQKMARSGDEEYVSWLEAIVSKQHDVIQTLREQIPNADPTHEA